MYHFDRCDEWGALLEVRELKPAIVISSVTCRQSKKRRQLRKHSLARIPLGKGTLFGGKPHTNVEKDGEQGSKDHSQGNKDHNKESKSEIDDTKPKSPGTYSGCTCQILAEKNIAVQIHDTVVALQRSCILYTAGRWHLHVSLPTPVHLLHSYTGSCSWIAAKHK